MMLTESAGNPGENVLTNREQSIQRAQFGTFYPIRFPMQRTKGTLKLTNRIPFHVKRVFGWNLHEIKPARSFGKM